MQRDASDLPPQAGAMGNRPCRRSLSGMACLVAAVVLTAGCATALPPGAASPPHAADPWESFNRKVFSFNDAVDTAIVKPVAQAWRRVVPQPVRQGVSRIFDNLGDVWTSVNMMLQGKPGEALQTGVRVGLNTVFGIFGIFDVAETVGLERSAAEDFGQTLGRWGMPAGPYMVLPFLGPSTLRDTAGLPVDLYYGSPSTLADGARDKWAVTGLRLVDTRARLLGASQVLDDIALDKYVLLRDGYLARRRSQIYDGNPPEEPDDAPPAETPTIAAPAAASSAAGPALTPTPAAVPAGPAR